MIEKNKKAQNLTLFLKNLAFFIFLVLSALVVVPLELVWVANGFLSFSIVGSTYLGLLLTIFGAIFMLNMFVYFALSGKGTPAPFDPPKKLITRGLFRYVRNPGYIGGALIVLGEGFFLESAVVFVFAASLCILFHLFVVYYEEPTLKREFGESYEDYLKAVPRWIPRLPKNIRNHKMQP